MRSSWAGWRDLNIFKISALADTHTTTQTQPFTVKDKNYMSSSPADFGLGRSEGFKYLNHCHLPGWFLKRIFKSVPLSWLQGFKYFVMMK